MIYQIKLDGKILTLRHYGADEAIAEKKRLSVLHPYAQIQIVIAPKPNSRC